MKVYKTVNNMYTYRVYVLKMWADVYTFFGAKFFMVTELNLWLAVGFLRYVDCTYILVHH